MNPPSPASFIPFAALLLAIAIFPLLPHVSHWWEKNRNKLLVSLALAAITVAGYLAGPGPHALGEALDHALLEAYLPFIILLFTLYTIAGGIHLSGDIRATPGVNTTFLGVGAVLASFIGTTGASMLLIRPVLRTNAERKRKIHTVVFFIFIVSNVGGCLTPLGDPPLFLGYLQGVPFWWTFRLFPAWILVVGALLAIYWLWDRAAYARERPEDLVRDIVEVQPLGIRGALNFPLLGAVVACVAFVDPNLPLGGIRPPPFLREALLLLLAAASWFSVPGNLEIRRQNGFTFGAILEVGCLFLGIFICMQPPIEYLNARGADLGLRSPAGFFWASGGLSSFLDNAPTYRIFFELARAVSGVAGPGMPLPTLLAAVSLGSVFMGANTYIGNGPNFMVKSIAESCGVRMPSFFGYMGYAIAVLIPLFVLVTFLFFR